MSKAFLRDTDGADDTPLPTPASTLPPGAKNYLTPDGARRLRDELARLVERERPPLSARAADPEVKRELQRLDLRIRALEQSLATAEIVAPPAGDHANKVRFGDTVTVREPGDGETRYRIVGVDESDPGRGWISWQSPLGRALLNAHAGEHVTFHTPRGQAELEVTAIETD